MVRSAPDGSDNKQPHLKSANHTVTFSFQPTALKYSQARFLRKGSRASRLSVPNNLNGDTSEEAKMTWKKGARRVSLAARLRPK